MVNLGLGEIESSVTLLVVHCDLKVYLSLDFVGGQHLKRIPKQRIQETVVQACYTQRGSPRRSKEASYLSQEKHSLLVS